MGFWKAVGKFVQGVSDAFDDDNSEVQEYAKMLRDCSDADLVGMLQESSGMAMSINERSAVQKVLRDRYPDNEKHNDVIRRHWNTSKGAVSSRWLR